ncbi:unnamed protein product, partial [Mesorhabditis belari]|uniref:Uncharacterized protein n=1 Tax=Mesorhabditis belari TaxID=2138241 RepID=A0AAF3FCT1_9BILA
MDDKEIDEMFEKAFQESLELWKKALPTAASYDSDELLKPTEEELRECGLWLSPEKGESASKATKMNQFYVSDGNKQKGRFFGQKVWSDDEDDDIEGGETYSKLTQAKKGQVSADSNVLRVDSSTKQISINEQVEGSEAETSSRYTFRKRRTRSKVYWNYPFCAKKPVKGMNELLPSASIGLDTGEDIFKHLKELKEQAKQRDKVKTRPVKKASKKATTKKLGPPKQTPEKAARKKRGPPAKKSQAKAATKKDKIKKKPGAKQAKLIL